jgi:hypothetical protein
MEGEMDICKSFEFNQSSMLVGSGWCAGISMALIRFLHKEFRPRAIDPAEAYDLVQAYTSDMLYSYGVTEQLEEAYASYRRYLARMQERYAGPVGGNYEYEFRTPGVALLNLIVGTDERPPRRRFAWWWWPFGPWANHAGLAVWDPGRFFIFDPNCGGILYNRGDNPVTDMDLALLLMYYQYDRLSGQRSALVISAQKVVPTQEELNEW